MTRRRENDGKYYSLGEIALVYLCKRDRWTVGVLAELLGRSEAAVDLLWKIITKRYPMPETAQGRVYRQIAEVAALIGNPGTIDLKEVVLGHAQEKEV